MTRPRIYLTAVLVSAVILMLGSTCYSQQRGGHTDEDVGKAIDKAKKYLWSQFNKDFVYDEKLEKDVPPWYELRERYYGKTGGLQYGGWTAMILYALLTSGEKYDDPSDPDQKIKKAVEWLASQKDSDGTYAIGARMQVWASIPKSASITANGVKTNRDALLARDVKILIASMAGISADKPIVGALDPNKYKYYGMFDYGCDKQPPSIREACHSNMHFGFLGIWAATRCGIEIPKEFWKLIYEHYVAAQESDGSWSYRPGGEGDHASGGMTAAGLANLLVANDYLFADKFAKCGNNTDIPAVVKAVKWLGDNFSEKRYTFYYFHYCLERAGLGTGYKFLGDKDWFKLGVANLLSQQNEDGSFRIFRASDIKDGGGDGHLDGVLSETTKDGKHVVHLEVPTAFAMLFLVRGRAPVIINKLWYNGHWNNRPTAAANLAKFASDSLETEVNWQIVPIQAPTEAWHDTPALLICGHEAPTFSDEEIAKLRTFVNQGGTIVSVVECDGEAFNKAMREVYSKMFPKLEFAKCEPDHRVFHAPFKIPGNSHKIFELSNKLRPLVFHVESDIALSWQMRASTTQKSSYQIMLNVLYILGGGKNLRNRGTSPWPEKPATIPTTKIPLVRLKYTGGNDDPEPMAWERLSIMLAKEGKLLLEVAPEPIEIAKLPDSKAKIAVLTGTTKLTIGDEEKAAIKKFVESGGILVVDSAGSSEKFDETAQKTMNEIFGAGKLSRTSLDKAPFALLPKEFKAKFRRGSPRKSGELEIFTAENNGKPGVFYFPDDITTGLLGLNTIGIHGLTPETSFELARCIVNYAGDVK